MVDNHAHFSVQTGGTGVEVERTDKHPLAVHYESFGVQAGGRTAGQAFVPNLGRGEIRFDFIQFDTRIQQVFAVTRIARMHGGHVGGAQGVG